MDRIVGCSRLQPTADRLVEVSRQSRGMSRLASSTAFERSLARQASSRARCLSADCCSLLRPVSGTVCRNAVEKLVLALFCTHNHCGTLGSTQAFKITPTGLVQTVDMDTPCSCRCTPVQHSLQPTSSHGIVKTVDPGGSSTSNTTLQCSHLASAFFHLSPDCN